MPTYNYKCKDCEYIYEAFQSIKEEKHKTCPKCKGSVIRLIGAGAGIVFKGSGFYVTDYRKKDDKKNSKEAKNQKTPSKDKTNSSTQTTKT